MGIDSLLAGAAVGLVGGFTSGLLGVRSWQKTWTTV